MRFYKGNTNVVKSFELVKNDKVTPVPLSGTITWIWKTREDVQPSGSPLTGAIISAPNGLVDFTIPATMLADVGKYRTFINITDGSYDEDFKPINVEVVKGSA